MLSDDLDKVRESVFCLVKRRLSEEGLSGLTLDEHVATKESGVRARDVGQIIQCIEEHDFEGHERPLVAVHEFLCEKYKSNRNRKTTDEELACLILYVFEALRQLGN